MLKNYFITALRNLTRHLGYSLINIVGLTVAMACCVLISLFIHDELKVDRFHTKSDRIYRLLRETQLDDGNKDMGYGTSGAAGPALKRDYPDVETVVRYMSWGGIWAKYEDRGFNQQFCLTDPDFLSVFDFELVSGNRETALSQPLAVLITQSTAKRYFGDQDAMGKVLSVDDRYMGGDYTVTGILKDIPPHSTLQFDILCATVNTFWTRSVFENFQPNSVFRPANNYILLREGADVKSLEQQMPQFMARYMGEEILKKNTYYLQPFERIYLYSKADYNIPFYSDITHLYSFATIGLFILIIASINFMNLATARSARRPREVGLRKVVGAYRGQLIRQFLGESFLMALLALIAVYFALPHLNDFVQKQIALSGTTLSFTLGSLFILSLLVGLIAGGYPALFLSNFRPVLVLKGSVASGAKSGYLRQILVVFQFAISAFLIASTFTVYLQLEYVRDKNLGFDKENLVLTWIFGTDRRLTDRYINIKNEFLQHPDILKASASHATMGYGGQLDRVYPEGKNNEEWQMRVLGVDESFLDTYGIELVSGRNFSLDIPTDSTQAYLLNQTAVKRLGWHDPLGKKFEWNSEIHGPPGQVVGIVKDFHNRSLHEEIQPVALAMWQPKFNVLALKIRGQNIEESIAYIGEVWKRHVPEKPFEYRFLDTRLDNQYRSEQRIGTIANVFGVLAIIVACLGLFGLASFTAEIRTKEIGVRKTLGATVPNIVRLLSREFIILVIIADAIAFPLTYFVMQGWLDGFIYRIEIGPAIFLFTGCLTFTIALLTVSSQAIKAAFTNPIDALRYE
jgi:putative ABC transport system permease protein